MLIGEVVEGKGDPLGHLKKLVNKNINWVPLVYIFATLRTTFTKFTKNLKSTQRVGCSMSTREMLKKTPTKQKCRRQNADSRNVAKVYFRQST